MGDLPFSRATFGDWFDAYARDFLEPAREAAVRAISKLLDKELTEIERIRIRLAPGRVKGKERAWRKLESRYSDKVAVVGDIPGVMDDLVGLRIVCNNKSDVQRVVDIIHSLDSYHSGIEPVVLVKQDGSFRNYVKEPKETGYRAIHMNLCASVPSGLNWKVVTCELQIRTLLQDGWGELSHEDTYKPGSPPPVLVEMLSRRMADLLAAVDDIAQDLRNELDELANLNVEEPPRSTRAAPSGSRRKDLNIGSQLELRTAAMEYLRNRLSDLVKPVDLASIAWELRKEFGQEISEGWCGYGSFKALVKASIPHVRVTSEPPSLVLPQGYEAPIPTVAPKDPDIPISALILRGVDSKFPLIGSERLRAAFKQLAEATRQIDWDDPTPAGIPVLNALTRHARELNSETCPVSRAHLDYIAKAVMFSGNLNRTLRVEEIRDIYTESTISRIRDVADLDEVQEREIRVWLT